MEIRKSIKQQLTLTILPPQLNIPVLPMSKQALFSLLPLPSSLRAKLTSTNSLLAIQPMLKPWGGGCPAFPQSTCMTFPFCESLVLFEATYIPNEGETANDIAVT